MVKFSDINVDGDEGDGDGDAGPQLAGDVSGPDRREVVEYEILSEDDIEKRKEEFGEENVDAEPHPAADILKEFAVDMSLAKSEKSAARYFRGAKTLVAYLDIVHGIANPLEAGRRETGTYLRWLINTRYSENERRSKFYSVSVFYGWAEDEEFIDENPMEGREIRNFTFDSGAIEESRDDTEGDDYKWVTPDKVRVLWEADNVPSPRLMYELAFKLLWFTGVRGGELCEAKIIEDPDPGEKQWLDREEGWIRVPNFKQGRNQDDTRRCYYPRERIEPLLAEWLDREMRDAHSPYASDSPFLLLTHQSEQLRSGRLSRKVKEAAFSAGVQEPAGYDVNGQPRWMITAHCIRHSAATHWCNDLEVPIHHVARQLGHSQLDTTLKYVHDKPKARRDAFSRHW